MVERGKDQVEDASPRVGDRVRHLHVIKSSVSIASICTTSRQIPASASTNQGPEKGDFGSALRAGGASRHLDVTSERRESRAAPGERDFFIDNLLVRIHLIILMLRWTGLAP